MSPVSENHVLGGRKSARLSVGPVLPIEPRACGLRTFIRFMKQDNLYCPVPASLRLISHLARAYEQHSLPTVAFPSGHT